MSIEKNNANPGAFDKSKKLLDELSADIAREYGIDLDKARELIQNNAKKSLDDLKIDIADILPENESSEQKDKLFNTLLGAREVIDRLSKDQIDILKKELETSDDIIDFTNNLEKYLPADLIKAATDPKKPHEHILGFTLGTAESIYATTDALLQIGKGIIKTPFDIYMIISGKGSTDSFKDI